MLFDRKSPSMLLGSERFEVQMPKLPRFAACLLCLGLIAMPLQVARAADDDPRADARKDRNDTKRAVNQADHRIDEAGCTASRAECSRRQKSNRMQEAKEKASDQIHEAADRAHDGKK
jgi:hypothetical protein